MRGGGTARNVIAKGSRVSDAYTFKLSGDSHIPFRHSGHCRTESGPLSDQGLFGPRNDVFENPLASLRRGPPPSGVELVYGNGYDSHLTGSSHDPTICDPSFASVWPGRHDVDP